MATVGVVNGHYMRFFDNGVSLGYSTSCSIAFNATMRELSHKDTAGSGGGWLEQAPGQKSGTFSTEGLYAEDDNAAAALFQKLADGTEITLTFTTDVSGDKVWSGTALLTSVEITAPNNENVTYSVSGVFTGEVTVDTVA
jgi:TP901-1 family phage major tail protein